VLRRLFFAFPDGLPGVALLLLRAVSGAALLVQSAFYFREPPPTPAVCLAGCSGLAAGALLLTGLLTPIAATIATLDFLSIALAMAPATTPSLFDSKLAVIFAMAMLLAVIVLGPGAFSIDARLFGRREIIIPPSFSRDDQ
jgi:uncharacterized membrane protein YphA (DoxX/SURF4 family)